MREYNIQKGPKSSFQNEITVISFFANSLPENIYLQNNLRDVHAEIMTVESSAKQRFSKKIFAQQKPIDLIDLLFQNRKR